jgi:hypothetical protein
MSWLNEHKNVGRVAVLLLLLVAFFGPWTHTSDGVPPAEWCSDPNILLENGRCVRLVSGWTVLNFMAFAFFGLGAQLVSGRMGFEILREFLFVLILFLLVLPIVSSSILIRSGNGRRMRVFQVIAWGLAAVPVLLLVASGWSGRAELWGLWLYTGIATGALVLELAARRRFG